MWKSVVAFTFFVTCGMAQAALGTQHCSLATKSGPYTYFNIRYSVAEGKFLSKKVTISLRYSKESGSVKESVTLKDIDFSLVKGNAQIKLYFEHDDWQSTQLDLAEDDDGVGAFVDSSSDGPKIRSFYRCTKFPMTLSE